MAQPGDKLQDFVTARWYNKIDAYVAKKTTGINTARGTTQQDFIWVANHEAVAKEQFTVVAIDEPSASISDRIELLYDEPVYKTKALSDAEPDNIFILLDPLPGVIGAEARALVNGVSLLKTKSYLISDAPVAGKCYQYQGPTQLDLNSTSVGRIQELDYFELAVSDDVHEYHLVTCGLISNVGGTIEFTIDSIETHEDGPYTGLVVATVTVETAPCALSYLIDTQVEVVDHSGNVFDLPEADLVGLWGWASERVSKSLDESAEPGTISPCHWAADDRQCSDEEGSISS